MAQQRDSVKELSPPWLTTGVAERLLYDFGLSADVLLEKLNQATKAHMPGVGTTTALMLIGNDRLMPQGPYESLTSYATRLQGSFDAWQHAGERRSVLQQVVNYLDAPTFGPSSVVPVAAIVGGATPTAGPNWDVYYSPGGGGHVNATVPPVRIFPATTSFNWDNQMTRWWRAWLVLYFTLQSTGRTGTHANVDTFSDGSASISGLTGMTAADVGNFLTISGAATTGNNGPMRIEQYVNATTVIVSNPSGAAPDANNGAISWVVGFYPTIGPGPAWGAPGALWGDATRSWGLNVPPGIVQGIKQIVRQWKSGHSYYPDILMVFGGGDGTAGNEQSPYSTPGSGNPDGNWGTFHKYVGGVAVPARVSPAPFGRFHCFAGEVRP